MRIKKNDVVKVISGKDKGKTGRVISVYTKKNRVLVEGVAFVKRHTKVQQGDKGAKKGGIETMESPIHISNVMLIDKETKTVTRTGRRKKEDGTTVRYSKKSGEEI
jgi:large subunit ribosomal protein L24